MKKVYTYQVVDEVRQPFGHILYQLRHTTAKNERIEIWVGQTKLKRMYKSGKIVGQISKQTNYIVGNEPKRTGTVKKEKHEPRIVTDGPIYSNLKDMDYTPKVEPSVEPVISFWQTTKAEDIMGTPKKWNVPQQFDAIPDVEIKATGRAYLLPRADGRYCMVYPDGKLDEDWTPLEMAQDYMKCLNDEVDGK